MRRKLPFLLALMLGSGVVFAQQEGMPADGEVRMTILAPDATPLAGAPIEIRPADASRGNPPAPESHVTTDAQGLAVFRWPAGETQFRVITHAGQGAYGTTGIVIVKRLDTVTVPLPPLVPLAHVEGTLPESAHKPDTHVVAFRSGSFGRWGEGVAVSPDENGRFSIDLISGVWSIWANAGNQRTAQGGAPLILEPGTHINNCALMPPPVVRATNPPPEAPLPVPGTIIIAQGTVRDAKAQPVAGASVYVSAEVFGGHRITSPLLKTATDAAGHYSVSLPNSTPREVKPGAVFVAAPDRPITWAYLAPLDSLAMAANPPAASGGAPRSTDIILQDHSGTLDVRVLTPDGRPAADMAVVLRSHFSPALAGPNASELLPTAQTNPDGVAHFANLALGVYQVAAGSTPSDAQSLFSVFPNRNAAVARFDGVSVRDRQTTAISVQLVKGAAPAPVRLLKSDGSPDLQAAHAYNYQRIGSSGLTSSSAQGDANGILPVSVTDEGLWRFGFEYRDGQEALVRHPPCIGAGGYLAISSLLPPQPPLTLQGAPSRPGSIQFALRDGNDRPLRGYVELDNDSQLPMLSGAAGAARNVLFTDVPMAETEGPWNRYLVRVTIPGQTPLDLRSIASAADIPPDDQLRNREEYLCQWVRAVPNQDIVETLRPVRAGYIRGKILGGPQPDPTLPQQRYVFLGRGRLNEPPGATVQYFPDTGDFVAGPLAAGDVELGLTAGERNNAANITLQRVTVSAGNVTHFDLHAPESLHADNYAAPFLDVNARLNAIVFLSDGTTPAPGASVDCYFPNAQHPVVQSVADVTGHLSAHFAGVISLGTDPDFPPLDSPLGYIAVASLPGTCGSVIVPVPAPLSALNAPLHIVLPPPLRARGTVSVDGLKFPLAGHVRVLAAYTGKGKLNGPLSVETNANTDGSFELAGLTSGHYQVQAALDDLWLSDTIELDVTEHVPSTPLALKIAAPGAPTIVKLGAPNLSIQVSGPAGPLAQRFSIPGYTTDASGALYIPTLESGQHRVLAPGNRQSVINVAPATVENTAHPQEITLQTRP